MELDGPVFSISGTCIPLSPQLLICLHIFIICDACTGLGCLQPPPLLLCLQHQRKRHRTGWSSTTHLLSSEIHRFICLELAFHSLSILTLKMPRKTTSENVICLCCRLHLLANFSNILFAYRQTVWTQIRLLLEEQSDLGPHCLQQWLLK